MNVRDAKDDGAAPARPFCPADGEAGWSPVLPRGAAGVVVLFTPPARGREPDHAVGEVARALYEAGIGTVAVDPVPDGAEEGGHEHRFQIGAMAERLKEALDRLARERRTRALPVGCVATGTAGAAALRAAAARHGVRAVAVLEGRPDLAGIALQQVRAPTLLVVAGLDTPLLRLNRQALRRLHAPAMLEVVPGALYGLEDPEAREMAVARVVDWFCTHLGVREPARIGSSFGEARHPVILTR